jgi:hypothetical protein
MSTDLAVRDTQPRQLTALSTDQLQFIANTEFVPRDLRGNLPAIMACVATGRALGIADITALRSIHIIDGRPTYSAELMVMLARRAGHSIQGEVEEGRAVVRGKRLDNGDEMTVTWTLAMAERAGLLSKQNWRKYPEAMLWARAVSQLCRELFADCFAGATYVPEELEDVGGGSDHREVSDVSTGTGQASTHNKPAGEPERAAGPVAVSDASTSSVSQAAASTVEPASPADEIAAEVFGDTDPEPRRKADEKLPATAAQLKKLNVLVGPMDQDMKRRVYATVALWRVRGTDALMAELGGVYDGALHWSPLRDSLTKDEAHRLIDRLEAHAKEQA